MTAQPKGFPEVGHDENTGFLSDRMVSANGFYRQRAKRALDILLILLCAPFVAPIVLGLALLVSLDGAAPFFSQLRVGHGGKVFRLLKLRTMVPGADALLEAHLASDSDARREWDRTQKLRHDPRITRFGGFLRKSSLDELPQLWNVLRGDMSLVGPRPMLVDQKPLYPGREYYRLRPGITGFWQVSDRNNSSFAERARFDTSYYRQVSFMTDTVVLLRTVIVVLRCTGF
jgi:lipopolysaccharide/colanic/teichoic acid biosynthesis glycosyltransferase